MFAVATIDPRAQVVESLLRQKNKSVRWLARQLEVSHTTVGFWIEGSTAPRDDEVWDRMIHVLKRVGLPSNMPNQVGEVKPIYRTPMRMVAVGVAYCGKPNPTVEDVEWEEVRDWGDNFDRWGKKVIGSSMEDELLPNDIVIFENRRHESGNIVHAVHDNGQEEVIKVYRQIGDRKMLWSINSEHDNIQMDESWEILGVGVVRIRYLHEGIRDMREYPGGMRYRFSQSIS